MINSEPPNHETQDDAVARVVAPPIGAATLAGLATAIVVAIWLGFYFLVFVPRNVP